MKLEDFQSSGSIGSSSRSASAHNVKIATIIIIKYLNYIFVFLLQCLTILIKYTVARLYIQLLWLIIIVAIGVHVTTANKICFAICHFTA